jgi:hypothetical protein
MKGSLLYSDDRDSAAVRNSQAHGWSFDQQRQAPGLSGSHLTEIGKY